MNIKNFKKELESGVDSLVGSSQSKKVFNLLRIFWKRNKKQISALVFFVFVGFLIRNITLSWQEIQAFQWNITPKVFFWVFISALAVYPVNMICWHLVVKSLGGKINFFDNARVWIVSNAARFLPGGVWQYPGRVYLVLQKGVSKKIAVTATLLELLLNVLVGVFISAAVFIQPYLWISALGFLVALFIIKKLFSIKLDYLLLTTLAFFIKFFITGAVLVFLSSSALPLSFGNTLLLQGVFALSWLAGYVVIFAPGGLGVTEASLASLLTLTTPLGLGVASALALGYRFVLIIVELLVLTITLFKLPAKRAS